MANSSIGNVGPASGISAALDLHARQETPKANVPANPTPVTPGRMPPDSRRAVRRVRFADEVQAEHPTAINAPRVVALRHALTASLELDLEDGQRENVWHHLQILTEDHRSPAQEDEARDFLVGLQIQDAEKSAEPQRNNGPLAFLKRMARSRTARADQLQRNRQSGARTILSSRLAEIAKLDEETPAQTLPQAAEVPIASDAVRPDATPTAIPDLKVVVQNLRAQAARDRALKEETLGVHKELASDLFNALRNMQAAEQPDEMRRNESLATLAGQVRDLVHESRELIRSRDRKDADVDSETLGLIARELVAGEAIENDVSLFNDNDARESLMTVLRNHGKRLDAALPRVLPNQRKSANPPAGRRLSMGDVAGKSAGDAVSSGTAEPFVEDEHEPGSVPGSDSEFDSDSESESESEAHSSASDLRSAGDPVANDVEPREAIMPQAPVPSLAAGPDTTALNVPDSKAGVQGGRALAANDRDAIAKTVTKHKAHADKLLDEQTGLTLEEFARTVEEFIEESLVRFSNVLSGANRADGEEDVKTANKIAQKLFRGEVADSDERAFNDAGRNTLVKILNAHKQRLDAALREPLLDPQQPVNPPVDPRFSRGGISGKSEGKAAASGSAEPFVVNHEHESESEPGGEPVSNARQTEPVPPARVDESERPAVAEDGGAAHLQGQDSIGKLSSLLTALDTTALGNIDAKKLENIARRAFDLVNAHLQEVDAEMGRLAQQQSALRKQYDALVALYVDLNYAETKAKDAASDPSSSSIIKDDLQKLLSRYQELLSDSKNADR